MEPTPQLTDVPWFLIEHLFPEPQSSLLRGRPRRWHNLRSSAQTELAGRLPLHVACAWLGNSQAIAADHDVQVTDEHFKAPLLPSEKALRNPARRLHESARMKINKTKKPLVSKGLSFNEWRVGDLNP